MNNPTYVKLLQLLNDNCYSMEIQLAWGEAEDVLQVVWPTIVELLATINEYEHALEHVADVASHQKLNQPACDDCARLARGALNGDNHEDFKEMINDDFE